MRWRGQAAMQVLYCPPCPVLSCPGQILCVSISSELDLSMPCTCCLPLINQSRILHRNLTSHVFASCVLRLALPCISHTRAYGPPFVSCSSVCTIARTCFYICPRGGLWRKLCCVELYCGLITVRYGANYGDRRVGSRTTGLNVV